MSEWRTATADEILEDFRTICTALEKQASRPLEPGVCTELELRLLANLYPDDPEIKACLVAGQRTLYGKKIV